MLDSAYSEVSTSTASFIYVGLTATLTAAASEILRLAEHEPYGIRGASLILKLRFARPRLHIHICQVLK